MKEPVRKNEKSGNIQKLVMRENDGFFQNGTFVNYCFAMIAAKKYQTSEKGRTESSPNKNENTS